MMNGICYLHNDVSCLSKENKLISQAGINFSVCRNNNVIFKASVCRNYIGCCDKKIHFFIKNCTHKIMNETSIKLIDGPKQTVISIGRLECGQEILVSEIVNGSCNYLTAQLIVGNDIIQTLCLK